MILINTYREYLVLFPLGEVADPKVALLKSSSQLQTSSEETTRTEVHRH